LRGQNAAKRLALLGSSYSEIAFSMTVPGLIDVSISISYLESTTRKLLIRHQAEAANDFDRNYDSFQNRNCFTGIP
jgi:hypothetical protein